MATIARLRVGRGYRIRRWCVDRLGATWSRHLRRPAAVVLIAASVALLVCGRVIVAWPVALCLFCAACDLWDGKRGR